MSYQVARALLGELARSGGGSIRIPDCALPPRYGAMVSVPGSEVTFTREITTRDVVLYLDTYPVPEGRYVGVWRDERTGTVYLDQSVWVENVREAAALGERHAQLAIYRLDTCSSAQTWVGFCAA